MLQAAQRRIWEQLPEDAVVLDVGAGASPFPRADWIIDLLPYEDRVIYGAAPDPERERFRADRWVVRDICDHEPWPFADKQFDFAVCSHTLEDVRDPIFVCHELIRVAEAGYIEVPSRLEEQSFGFQGQWAGWGHHRWLIDLEDDELTFVLKHHIINGEPRFQFPPGFQQSLGEEERVLQLWWTGGFRYRERMFYDAGEFDDYLSRYVGGEQAARRPPVTVVMPWRGPGRDELSDALAALEALSRREGDALVVAGTGPPPAGTGKIGWQQAGPRADLAEVWNAAVAGAPTDWVLLLLPDARPRPDMVNWFFVPHPEPGQGALVAGRTREDIHRPIARYLSDRELAAEVPRGRAAEAAAHAGALLVEREAWRAAGGFSRHAGGAIALDFVRRVQAAGFVVGVRNAASPVDVAPPLTSSIVRRRFELGAGEAGLTRGSSGPAPSTSPVHAAARHATAAIRTGAQGHPRQAAFLALDALGDAAEAVGRASARLSERR